MIKRLKDKFIIFCSLCLAVVGVILSCPVCGELKASASDDELDYYTIYNAETEDVLFLKGEGVKVNDEYISADNKLYLIEYVNDEEKVGEARYIENVQMPVFNVKKNEDKLMAVASDEKIVGLYHTHNDECYNDADGTDSVYGKGGIHDVGKEFKSQLEKLGVKVLYNETLHLPHDSGAYTRSLATAKELVNSGADGVFDVHRDATPRREYITTVNGKNMSKIRMVVGSANQNSAVNKEFALTIKAYADEIYPGLIKDIYIGKGNYNQQLFERAMLFEFGTNTIEKQYVLNSCVPLAKTLDVVLFGTNNASEESLGDLDIENSNGELVETGLVGAVEGGMNSGAGLSTLWIVLIILGSIALIFALIMIFSKKARQRVKRFFTELSAGMFKRDKSKV